MHVGRVCAGGCLWGGIGWLGRLGELGELGAWRLYVMCFGVVGGVFGLGLL